MMPGPLRRLVGTLGLLALAPTALMLGVGQIAPSDAALRAVTTLAAAVVIGRGAGWWVAALARGLESSAGSAEGADADAPQRRRGDVPAGASGGT